MEEFVNFNDGIIYNDEIWFSNGKFNALQKMNLKTGEITLESFFPEFSKDATYLHLQLFEYDKKIYFIPLSESIVNVWDLERNKWLKSIQLPYDVKRRYARSFLHGSNIWVFPYSSKDNIIKIDLVNNKVFELRELTDAIKKYFSEEVFFCPATISVKNNKIYLAAFNNDILLVIDCNTETIIEKYKLENENLKGIQPINDKECLFFNNEMTELFIWDLVTNQTKPYHLDFEIAKNRVPFSSFLLLDKKIIVLPRHIDEIFVLDLDSDELVKLSLPANFKRTSPFSLIGFAKVFNGIVYLFPQGCNKLLCVNLENLSVTEVKQNFSQDFSKYFSAFFQKEFEKKYREGSLKESKYSKDTLGQFLDLVCSGEQTDLKMETSNAGLNIHEKIKKLLSQ